MIRGVTDNVRLPRGHKIHLGVQLTNCRSKECGERKIPLGTGRCPKCGSVLDQDRGYPMAVGHFVCESELLELLAEHYPEMPGVQEGRPTELEVMFHSDDLEECFPQSYRCYTPAGLACKGDGEKLLSLRGEEPPASREVAIQHKGEYRKWVFTRCAGDRKHDARLEGCPAYAAKTCKMVASLRFYMPRLPGLGFCQIDTSSIHGILNLNNGFRLVRSLCPGGSLAWQPLRLRLRPEQVRYEEGGQRRTRDAWLLHLDTPRSIAELAAELRERQGLPEGGLRLLSYEEETPEDLFPAEVIGSVAEEGPALLPPPPSPPSAPAGFVPVREDGPRNPPETQGPTPPHFGATGAERGKCRGCDAVIYWWTTVAGKKAPCDYDGTSHFATCPEAESFRAKEGRRGWEDPTATPEAQRDAAEKAAKARFVQRGDEDVPMFEARKALGLEDKEAAREWLARAPLAGQVEEAAPSAPPPPPSPIVPVAPATRDPRHVLAELGYATPARQLLLLRSSCPSSPPSSLDAATPEQWAAAIAKAGGGDPVPPPPRQEPAVPVSPDLADRRRHYASIHEIAKAVWPMSNPSAPDSSYRVWLQRELGVSSAKDLTDEQLALAVERLSILHGELQDAEGAIR